ncbi:MAG: hypothetical protein O3C19_07895 [Bacteroidetes bacterium]|nr:hypothetical protein [Bacteroidota bacterium]
MSKQVSIEKQLILQYLEYASEEVDTINFIEWIEFKSNSLVKIDKAMKPLSFQKKVRGEDERTTGI